MKQSEKEALPKREWMFYKEFKENVSAIVFLQEWNETERVKRKEKKNDWVKHKRTKNL